MVTIPFLGRMVLDFLTLSKEDIQTKFTWNCYIFLLAIFVAMTNQVDKSIIALLSWFRGRVGLRYYRNMLDKFPTLTKFKFINNLISTVPDSQMVSHVLRPSDLGNFSSGISNNSPQTSSQDPPRGATWNVLLHYDGLAELATRKITFLERTGIPHRNCNGNQTQSGRFQMGPKEDVIFFYLFVTNFCIGDSGL